MLAGAPSLQLSGEVIQIRPEGEEGAGVPEPVPPPRAVRFGSYTLDLSAGELHKNGAKIRLAEQPFQILRLLLQRPGEVVTRDELRQHLWADDTFVDFETGLNSAVKKLRDVLGDSAEKPRFVETIPRRGYRFIYPVDEATALVGRKAAWSRWVTVGLLLAAMAVVLFAVLAGNMGGWRDRLFGRSAPITSLAVLPLENLTGDPALEYFVDGIHDELITQLAQVSSLKVISRTSVLRYKQDKKPIPEIARELGVQAVVEGAVKNAGDRVRITLQLIYAPTDAHLWAHGYDREKRDVRVLQSEVARAIINQLRIELTAQEQAQLGRARPVVPGAYEAYLQGKYYTVREVGDHFKQIEYFERAINLDPTFAPAWQGLADAYFFIGLVSQLPPREAYPKTRTAVLKALELDDSLAEAHATLGRIKYLYEWDWEGVEHEFARARELDPSWVGPTNYWTLTGRFDEAIAGFQRAIERDPLSSSARQNLGWAYFMAGRYDEAIAQLRKTLEMDPDRRGPHIHLALNYAKKGMHAEAIAECETGLTLLGPMERQAGLANCGWVYAVAGQRDKAMQLMQRIQAMAPRQWVDPLHIARIYDGLGDTERAIRFLYQAYEERSPWMIHLRMLPTISDRLRADARFQELLRRVGLPAVTVPPPGVRRGAEAGDSTGKSKEAVRR